jgi:Fic family protein
MALAEILQSIDEQRKMADSLRPIASERLKILDQKLRLDWNYNSNALEGNTLTLSETRMLLLHGYHTGNKLGRHYTEIELHNDVLLTLEDLVRRNEPMTEVLIRSLHHQLMGDDYFVSAYDSLGNIVNVKGRPGQYKDKTNGVKRIVNGKEIFVPFKTPDEVRIEMPELISWYRSEEEKAEMHPVMLAAIFHFRFVTLHPFDDGNGRMSRILMNMILMRSGYVPAIIRIDERTQYNANLALAQDGGTIGPFIELVANDTLRSLDLLVKAAKGESIEEPDDLDKEIELLKRNIKQSDIARIDINNAEHKPLWQKSIKDFLIAVDIKLQKFSSLFEKYSVGFRINQTSDIKNIIDIFIQSLNSSGTLSINYEFSRYKDSIHDFDIQLRLFIGLKDFRFSISYSIAPSNAWVSKEYTYNMPPGQSEINLLADNISKDLLKVIKERTEQK